MPEENNGTIKYRVGKLEEGLAEIDRKVDKIMTNHLPHIQQDMLRLEMKIERLKVTIKTATAINIGAIILAIVINRWIG